MIEYEFERGGNVGPIFGCQRAVTGGGVWDLGF